VAGVGTSALFMGFSSEEFAWTWLRQHLADKFEATLRSEERREIIDASKQNQRDAELAAMLSQLPVPKKGLN
jgi:hypothetical protein